MNKAQIPEIVSKIEAAGQVALEVPKNDPFDGGTCNFDSPMLDTTGWHWTVRKELQRQLKAKGINSFLRESGYGKGWLIIHTPLHGQGILRTRMAEAAARAMEQAGLPTSVYYQMD